jgi:hypothetical protein
VHPSQFFILYFILFLLLIVGIFVLQIVTLDVVTMTTDGVKKVRSECAALPRGWIREEVSRRSGLTVGRTDVYYYSPTGKRARSKQELIKILGDQLDLSTFDYCSGKLNASLIRTRTTAGGTGASSKQTAAQRAAAAKASQDARTGSLMRANNSLLPPIRQTASIFKQPVTVVKAHEAKVKSDVRTVKDKPRQLFWEKRLSGLSAYSPDQVMRIATVPTFRLGFQASGPVLL